MRVPFPIRVLASYLLVLVVGFLPTYIYLEVLFQERVSSYEVRQIISRTRRFSAHLSVLAPQQRLAALRQFGDLSIERVTYIGPDGKVLFDSEMGHGKKLSWDNHKTRAEVRLALGLKAPRLTFDPHLPGVGVARRISQTLRRDMLYVAVLVSQQSGQSDGILRIAIPASKVEALKQNLLQVFRNSLAAAISVALVLSLVSAVVFMRPLQQTARAAQALAEGDYSATLHKLSNDEIGDVGRSLNTLGAELRQRLALAEASEALLFQLVQIDKTPLAVFDEEGTIRALNGAARIFLEARGTDPKEVLGRWEGSSSYKRAWHAAAETQEAQDVTVEVGDGERKVAGLFYVIQHPSGASFGVFMGLPGPRERFSFLPPSVEVNPTPVAQVLEQSIQRAGPLIERFGVTVTQPRDPGAWVADVQERLTIALAGVLEGAASTTPEGHSLALWIDEQPLYIGVALEARIPEHTISSTRLLLGPIGGQIELEGGRCLLKLPRA